MGSFSKKVIETRITLAAGTFGGAGNQKTVRALATEVKIQKPGLPDKNNVSVSITNLNYEDIAELTTLGFEPGETRKNLIEVLAGEEGSDLSRIYAGEIVSAYGNFNTVPNPTLAIEGLTGYVPDLTPEAPATYKGQVPVADIIADIAKRIGYGFDNQGVSVSLRNPVLNGSPYQKALQAAKQAGVDLLVDDGTMILLPAGTARRSNAILLRDDSGLIGYPTFRQAGVSINALFNPAFELNGLIRIESLVPKASGTWRITKLTHELSADKSKGGSWKSSIEAALVSRK